jgi:hypothetical protein
MKALPKRFWTLVFVAVTGCMLRPLHAQQQQSQQPTRSSSSSSPACPAAVEAILRDWSNRAHVVRVFAFSRLMKVGSSSFLSSLKSSTRDLCPDAVPACKWTFHPVSADPYDLSHESNASSAPPQFHTDVWLGSHEMSFDSPRVVQFFHEHQPLISPPWHFRLYRVVFLRSPVIWLRSLYQHDLVHNLERYPNLTDWIPRVGFEKLSTKYLMALPHNLTEPLRVWMKATPLSTRLTVQQTIHLSQALRLDEIESHLQEHYVCLVSEYSSLSYQLMSFLIARDINHLPAANIRVHRPIPAAVEHSVLDLHPDDLSILSPHLAPFEQVYGIVVKLFFRSVRSVEETYGVEFSR